MTNGCGNNSEEIQAVYGDKWVWKTMVTIMEAVYGVKWVWKTMVKNIQWIQDYHNNKLKPQFPAGKLC